MTVNAQQGNRWFLAIVLSVLLSACGKESQAPGAGGMPAMPPMPVSFIEAAPTSVPISLEAVAQTEGAKEVEVRPRVGGILLKKMFEEGAEIKAGQTMFTIDPMPFQLAVEQAKAELGQQQARIEQTRRESQRLRSLLESKSISQREYDNAVSDNAIANANMLQSQAKLREAHLNLSYTRVQAPSSGVAGRFLLSEGALVSPNTSLLTTISQIAPIWVRFSLSDAELQALGGRVDAKTVTNVQLILPNGDLYEEQGQLNFAASTIDPQLGTQQLRATFPNVHKQLMPGQFVRVKISTGMKDGVYLVPQVAVMTSDQGKFVYVAEKNEKGDNVAGVRPIMVGGWEGKQWVVLSGLTTGEKVLVDNLIKIRPGAPIAPHWLGEPPAPPTNGKSPTLPAPKPSANKTHA